MQTIATLPRENDFRVVEVISFGQVVCHRTVTPGVMPVMPDGMKRAPCRVVSRAGDMLRASMDRLRLDRSMGLSLHWPLFHFVGHDRIGGDLDTVKMVGVAPRRMGNSWGVGPHVHTTHFWSMEAESPAVLRTHGAVLSGVCAPSVKTALIHMQETLMREFGYIRASSASEVEESIVGHVRLLLLEQAQLTGDGPRPGVHTSAFYPPIALASTLSA